MTSHPSAPASRGCVFCSIVAGSLPAHRIYEDQDTLAFLDIHPAAAGHTLVVPKTHATDLFTIAPETAAAVMRSATRVARRLDEVLTPDGLTVIQTNRAAGWQDVFHLHMHLVPRWDTDTLVRPWTPEAAQSSDLAAVAAQLQTRR